MRNTSYAQAEAWALLWIKFRSLNLGIVIPPKFWVEQSWEKGMSVVRSYLPVFRLDLMPSGTDINDTWLFRITILGFYLGFRSVTLDGFACGFNKRLRAKK